MADTDNNVVALRPWLHPRRDQSAEATATTSSQESRAGRDAATRARADDISNAVASFSGRISYPQRLVLAGNLGRLLYGSDSKRKHGDLSKILKDAGVAEEGDHTKRLPRYAIRPDRPAPSPKTLASKPENYLRIAEAAAIRFGMDRDRTVVSAFESVHLTGDEPDYDLADYFPLHRLLNALVEGVIKAAPVAEYFNNLAKWRWITRLDDFQREGCVAPFSEAFFAGPLGLEGVDIHHAMLHPDVVGQWAVDRNPFELDPDERDFYTQRPGLLPKIPVSAQSRIEVDWTAPFDTRIYQRSGDTDSEIELVSVKVGVFVHLYLVLAPMLPREEIGPHLARFPVFYAEGHYRVGGDLREFSSPWSEAHFVFRAGPPAILSIGFQIDQDTYVTVRREPAGITADSVCMTLDPYRIGHWPMELATPSSIAKYLKERIDIDDGEAAEVLATTRAPFKTRAANLESTLRSDWGVEIQKSLISEVVRLHERMNHEIAKMESASHVEERWAAARLANPVPDNEGGADD